MFIHKLKFTLIMMPILVCANILYVPQQYGSIQTAINFSVDSDTIVVSEGTYQENINFFGKNIVVTSNYFINQDSLIIENTIIDGNNDGSVVTFAGGEPNSTVLQGFTLRNGNGNYADPDENGSFYTYGGGVYCKSSSPTLKDLIISNNSGNAGGGGGVFCYDANPTIEGCIIFNNSTDDVGGGLYARNGSDVIIRNSQFNGNEADLGGGCYFRDQSEPFISNTDFVSNISSNSGGAIIFKDNADAILENVNFIDNETEGPGGALYINDASPNLDFVLMSGNVSSAGSGAYIRNDANPVFNHVTIGYNSSGFGGGAIYLRDGSDLIVKNSIIWGNSEAQIYFRDSGSDVSLDISYSLLEGGQSSVDINNNGSLDWGSGMLQSDPYFCNGPGGVYSLRENSPCVSSAEDGGIIGCFDVGCGPINTGPVWYVGELGDDLSDGSIQTPYLTIQRAVDACANGDTIRLMPGVYIEQVDFNSKFIVLESRAYELSDYSITKETVITGPEIGGSCMELIGQDASNIEIRDITFSGGQSQIGGGLYIENSSPILSGVIVENNTAEVGGGVYLNDSDVQFNNVIIKNNGANFGGGLYSTGSNSNLISSSIDSNIAYWGAGVYLENSFANIEKSNIRFNQAYIEGGGIYQNGNEVNLTEVAILCNNGLDFGGAVVSFSGLMNLDRCTISGNESNIGSGFNIRETVVNIINSILWNNSNSIYSSSGSQASMINVSYSNIFGGQNEVSVSNNIIVDWGDGNINTDPLFCNIDDYNYSLQEGSVCLYASSLSGPIGAYSSAGCDQLLSIDKINRPKSFSLSQNYPNPFNPMTNIKYSIHEPSLVSISIYSISGIWIKDLINNRYHNSGNYSVIWNSTGSNGLKVSSGIYIYKIVAKNKSEIRKMLLAK